MDIRSGRGAGCSTGRSTGIGLLEVLAASAVLATGIVCLLQLQLTARQLDTVTYQRLQASLQDMEAREQALLVNLMEGGSFEPVL